MSGTTRPGRSSGRSLGWFVLLVGTILVLRSAAIGDLTAPPLTSLDALADWTDAREPGSTAIALVRLVAEVVAWYLLGLTILYGLAATLRSGGMASLADALAAPGAARLVRGGLGLGLLASTAAAGAATPPGDVAEPSRSTASMRPLPAVEGDGTAWMVPVTEEVQTPQAAPTITAERPNTWTVSEGESFWSIAEDALADARGRTPTIAEIDPYWRALIDANRGRLVDGDDPDLIHPGQVFELPPT